MKKAILILLVAVFAVWEIRGVFLKQVVSFTHVNNSRRNVNRCQRRSSRRGDRGCIVRYTGVSYDTGG